MLVCLALSLSADASFEKQLADNWQNALFPLQPHRRPLYEWMGASLYEWQVVGLIVLAGVDLSPPDGAAMQMSTCPLCSLLAPARDGVPNFCSNWGFTMSSLLTSAGGEEEGIRIFVSTGGSQ